MNRAMRRAIKFGHAFSENRIWHQPGDMSHRVGVQADVEDAFEEWMNDIYHRNNDEFEHPQYNLWYTQISIL